MTRIFNQQEQQAFAQADDQLPQLGADFYDPQKAQHNANVVFQYFESNPTIPVTVDTIKQAALGVLKAKLYWKSALQIEADRIASRMVQADVDTITSWIG